MLRQNAYLLFYRRVVVVGGGGGGGQAMQTPAERCMEAARGGASGGADRPASGAGASGAAEVAATGDGGSVCKGCSFFGYRNFDGFCSKCCECATDSICRPPFKCDTDLNPSVVRPLQSRCPPPPVFEIAVAELLLLNCCC